MIDREQPIRSDEAVNSQFALLEISGGQLDRVLVASRLAGDLTENQVGACQSSNN